MFCALERKQIIWPQRKRIQVSMPIGATGRQLRTEILITVHHERRRDHCAKFRAIKGDEILSKVRNIRAVVSDAGEDPYPL